MKTRVLFVDDEPKVLEGLRRMLRGMRHEWDMDFVTSGADALERFDNQSFDIVVSDFRMPGMNGAQLLSKLQDVDPDSIRIVLSGMTKRESILRLVGPAHQYLSKPCTAEMLKSTIKHALELREVVTNENIRRVVSQIGALPSLPSFYSELMEEMQSEDASIKRIGEIMSSDVGMTAKVLQLVNSAYFGLPRHVASPADAVILLGMETIMALVLSVQVFSQFAQDQIKAFSLDQLMVHSIETGTLAKAIAAEGGLEKTDRDFALLAGLLHDCGKLLLAANFSKDYDSALELRANEGIGLTEAEQEIFGCSHAEIGGALLGIWGISDPIVEAVALHHRPNSTPDPSFSPLTAVHVANGLEHENGEGGTSHSSPFFDMKYLTQLQITDRLQDWRELMRRIVNNEHTNN